ncbi:MAG: hypothetical protein IJU62_09310 [Muribaculaceae bacterium]|nr:hypothetical protein [Muribaculaceae bacterium]
MSKRSLIIIIVMLVVVNVLAGLYYLGARMESEGRGLELPSGDTLSERADTVDIVTVADVFLPWESRRKTYVSPVDSDAAGRQRVCALAVKMRLPSSVNGNDSLSHLRRELARAAFGGNPLSLDAAITDFLARPQWNTSTMAITVTIEPRMTSQRLLVLAAERTVATPADTTTTTTYVHYDRLTHHVLARADILLPQAERELLKRINDKIAVLNDEKHLDLQAASRVPSSFRAQRTGLLFCYNEGELTSPRRGSIDVLVSYKVLGPCLTPAFKHLLWNNADYRNL